MQDNFPFQVEQLHKIFKLCGSPPDEYWKKSKLPHATIFRPYHIYESSLLETFKSLPESAISLLETFLSIEPFKRGTATTALQVEVSTFLETILHELFDIYLALISISVNLLSGENCLLLPINTLHFFCSFIWVKKQK